MTLKSRFIDLYNVDMPIKGGIGNSLDNAIIIERTERNDYVSLEYSILNLIGRMRGMTWKTQKQSLLDKDGKKYDKLTIKTCLDLGNKQLTQVESYYFDVTACIDQ